MPPKKQAPRPHRLLPDGTISPIEEKDIPAALTDGTLRYRAGERVPVISPSGKFGTVPASDVYEAGQRGFQVEPPSAYKVRQFGKSADTADHVWAAAKEAGSSASLGLTDVLGASVLGDGYTEQRRLEQEALPGSTTAGMLGGFFVPGLGEAAAAVKGSSWASRGVRALGSAAVVTSTPLRATIRAGERIGKGIAKGVAKPVPQRASALRKILEGGAVGAGRVGFEGGAIAAGQIVQHAALHDEELSVEMLLSGYKDGAVLGAVLGGPLGAAGPLVRTGFDQLKRVGGGGKPMSELAHEFAVKATAKQIGGPGLASQAKKFGKKERAVFKKLEQLHEDANRYKLPDGKPVRRSLHTQEQFHERVIAAGDEVLTKLMAARQEVAKATVPERAIAALWSKVGEVRTALGEFELPQLLSRQQEVARTFAWLDPKVRELPSGKTPRIAIERLNLFHQKLKGIVYPKSPTPGVPPPTTPAVEELRVLERELSGVLDDATERALARRNPARAGEYSELKRYSESFIKLEQLGSGAGVRALGAPIFTVGEQMAHIVGASVAWTGGAAVVPPLAGAMVAQRLIRTRGPGVASGLAEAISNMAKRNAAKARRTEKAIRSGIKDGAKKTEVAKPDSLSSRFAKQSEETRKAVENPKVTEKRREQQVAPLQALTPKSVDLALLRLTMGDKALADELPIAAPRYGQTDLGDGIPEAEKEQWLRLKAAVQDPPAAFEQFAKGELSIQEMNIIKQARPKLYEAFRSSALMELVAMYERNEVPAYDTLVRLSDLLGLPLDATQTSSYLLAMQTLHQGAANKEAEQAADARKAQQIPKIRAGRREPDFSKRAGTRAVAIAAR